MGNSAGAALVILLGLVAVAAGFALGVLLYRLDRRERDTVITHPHRRAATPSRDDRRPHAA